MLINVLRFVGFEVITAVTMKMKFCLVRHKFTDVSKNVTPLPLGPKNKPHKNRARTSRQSKLFTWRQYAPPKRRCFISDYKVLYPKLDYSSCYNLLLFCCWLYSHTTNQAANRKANNSPIRKLNSHSTL
jgi:hypothetical protein